MEWLNLHSSVLDSPEFVGEEPVNQATWLKLQRFCVGQENGGVIESCREWKDRKWQQLVRVTKGEVETASELWSWDGDNLIVAFYPTEKENEVKAKRIIAKTNGARGGRPKKIQEETNDGFSKKPTLDISAKAEGKGREGKGKEWNRKGESACAQAPPAESPEAIISKINSVKPSWGRVPHLTQAELYDLHKSKTGLCSIEADTWATLAEFARSHEGEQEWTLKTRARFLGNYTEALMKAAEWKEQGGQASPAHLNLGGRKAASRTVV